METNEARVNVTYAGANGDLVDPVFFDAADGDVRQWVAEAIRGGNIPGIAADPSVDLADFVLDRFSATDHRPYNTIFIRPKTPFGKHGQLAMVVKV